MLLELLDPVHDKAQSQSGRADGQEFGLFMLVDRDDLCVHTSQMSIRTPLALKKKLERKGKKTNRGNIESK